MRLARREPLVPRHLRLGVRERIRADGRVETPLDRSSLDAAIAELKRAGVTSVAVAYLHAYCNDAHEQETFAAVRAAMPEVGISLRSEEHTSELQSLMRISYAVFCLTKKKKNTHKKDIDK